MSLDALCTNKYSVANPVAFTFFADNISFATNPPTFATDIVVSEVPTNPPKEPDSTVEFATYNWPPTAFTVSFSNTAVANVPRILAFSTSRNPPEAAVNLNPLPFKSLAKPADSIVPSLLIIIEPPVISSLPIDQPPIVPDVDFNTPVFVTLNGAEANVPWPNWIPVSPSAIKISVPVPNDIDLPLASNVKFVAVNVLPLIVNPAICPLVAVTLPVIWAADAVIWPLAPFNFNVPEEASKSVPILNPPIVPVWAVILPVICALEAVICPLAPFNLNALLPPAELDKSSPIVNPPIVPVVAETFPDITTLPLLSKWKLLELISIFPFEPLIYWADWPR